MSADGRRGIGLWKYMRLRRTLTTSYGWEGLTVHCR